MIIYKKLLHQKDRLASNFVMYKLGLQLQYTYCPVSHEVKATNKTMKFGQLIEYNKRNIFLKKSCRK